MRLPSEWFLIVEPIDLRCGMDRLLVWVQQSGCAVSGSVDYAFRNLVKIGEHASEKLGFKLAEFFVERDVYPQYACRACETVIGKRPPTPPSGAAADVLNLSG